MKVTRIKLQRARSESEPVGLRGWGIGGREHVAVAAWCWGRAEHPQVSSWCAEDLESDKQGSCSETG